MSPDSSVVVADIGASHARLALAGRHGIRCATLRVLRVSEHPDMAALIAAYLDMIALDTVPDRRPSGAVLAVAGPIEREFASLTNRGWRFRIADLERALGLGPITVINDFEAQALALPLLPAAALHRIGGDEPYPDGLKLVLGPGTGLGAAMAVADGAGGWRVLPTEAGHIDLVARDARELALLMAMQRDGIWPCAEDAISGPGLAAIHRAMAERDGNADGGTTPEAIAEAGLAGRDLLAATAIDLMLTWLGRWAGDLALATMARGGVYISGPVARRLLPRLTDGPFRPAFEDKGRMAYIVKAIPTFVILEEHPGLIGAASLASRQLVT